MTRELVIHVTQRAAPTQAAWLLRLLAPVAAACRFDRPPPLEIRPTGIWGGWSSRRDFAIDGRVAVSSKLVFWSSESVIDVVIHEWVHRVLMDQKIFGHTPEFFCLNAVLLTRAAQFFDGDPLLRLGLYDLQDQPESLADEANWRGLVLNWALAAAAELARSDHSAEQLGDVVCERWQQFIDDRQASMNLTQTMAAEAVLKANKQAVRFDKVLDSKSLWRAIAVVGWLSFFSLFWVVWKWFN